MLMIVDQDAYQYKHLKLITNSQFMIQKDQDSDAVCHSPGPNISLRLLKNQIDNKIQKITLMVHQLSMKRVRTSRSHRSSESQQRNHLIEAKAVQTLRATQKLLTQTHNLQSRSHTKKGSVNAIKQLVQISQNDLKIRQGRECEVKRQKTKKHQSKPYEKQDFQNHLLPMIESNPFTFNQRQKENHNEYLQLSELNFEYEDDQLKYQIPDVQICSSVTDSTFQNRRKTSMDYSDDLSNSFKSITQLNLSKTTLLKNDNRHKRFLPKKIKYPLKDTVIATGQTRVQISDKCLLQMQDQVDQLIWRRRKEAHDNKLRVNVLKSIQDKYKEERMN